jgi:hypothetical protein
MANITRKVDLGGGVIMSIESDTPVPDTTADAGPDTIKLHEDAQKPATDNSAEYDAAEHVDVPENVETANESTFFGIILKHRSEEAFAKTKGVFPSADAFFKSNECKQAIAAAKQWAEKHKMSPASSGELPENLKKHGLATKVIAGATLAYSTKNNRLFVDILFKNAKGKVTTKKLAIVNIGEGKSTASEAAPAAKGSNAKPKQTPKSVLGKEADDPVDNAFAETTDPPPATEPAATEPATPPVTEPPAEPSEISADEIEAEAEGTESFIAAIAKVIRSHEAADAATANIDDKEIDEVVGDDEGEGLEETASTIPTPPASDPSLDDSEEIKAIESFLNSF